MGDGGGEGALKGGAVERTVGALSRFREEWTGLDVSSYRVVATSAAREAKNGGELVRAAGELGIGVEIISELEEARLSLSGIAGSAGVDIGRGSALIFDVGGGSTEFTLTEGGKVVDTLSTDIGVVRLTEMFVASDPPGEREILDIEKFVENRLAMIYNRYTSGGGKKKEPARKGEVKEFQGVRGIRDGFPKPPFDRLVGTAGTVTTLAAIDMGVESVDRYDPESVDGHTLSYSRISELFDILRSITGGERLTRYPVLEKGREDVIVAGVVIVLSVMKAFGQGLLTASDSGLLEGMVVDILGPDRADKKVVT
jgi:exopolyphosphatase/guanosine-5'-triphosphate,3'-diphosphate pyrophosphatase